MSHGKWTTLLHLSEEVTANGSWVYCQQSQSGPGYFSLSYMSPCLTVSLLLPSSFILSHFSLFSLPWLHLEERITKFWLIFLRLKCFDEVEVGAALIGFPLLNLGQMITSAVQGVTCSDEHTVSEVASAVQSISLVLWPSTLLFGSAIINLVSSSIRLLLSGIW